jgi:hypothetical protein
VVPGRKEGRDEGRTEVVPYDEEFKKNAVQLSYASNRTKEGGGRSGHISDKLEEKLAFSRIPITVGEALASPRKLKLPLLIKINSGDRSFRYCTLPYVIVHYCTQCGVKVTVVLGS